MSDNNEPKSEVLDSDEARATEEPIKGHPGPEKINVPMAVSRQPIATSGGAMLAQLVQNGVTDLALLEKFMDLRDREEAKEAKLAFDQHFAIMQGEFKPVKRINTARDETKGRNLYDYAALEDLVVTNGEAISRNGFSYSFREEALPDLKKRRFFLVVTGWGHTKETFVDLVEDSAKAPLMNGAQSTRSLSKYGQRYAMEAGFGMVTIGDDDDSRGMTFDMGVDYAEEIKLMREATTIPELYANYKTVTQNKDDAAKKMFFDLRFKLENEIRKAGA